MIEGHGDDLHRYGGRVRVNFSTNIPQHADHSGLLSHLARCGAAVSNYPEPAPHSVERLLAAGHGIGEENVMVANGATEAIYLLAHAYEGGKSAVIVPTFREYQDACRVFSHSVRFISSLEHVGGGLDMVWLCNPNNPTGRVYDRDCLLDVVDAFPSTLFVVDQAYAEYSVKRVLGVEDVLERGNVVMLHSLTKRFFVPGLRIGYAVGEASVLGRMRRLTMPWSVNALAIEAARYLLAHSDGYRIDAARLHLEAMRMAGAFSDMGMEVGPTDCNFVLVRLRDKTARELKEWLVERHGLLIRDASNFEGLSAAHFRVAAQSREENDMLINALKEWIVL